MFPVIYNFGRFSLKSYGLMLAIALFTGIYLARKEAKKADIDPGYIDLLSIGIILSAILGARFFFALTVAPDFYLRHPLQIFDITKGGLAFYGGFIFAVVFSIIYCRAKGLNFFKIADIISPSIALGLVFTRIGCFLSGCCYGKQCDLLWAVSSAHPTQIYSALNGLIIYFILISFRRVKRFEGQLFLTFVIIYSLTRPVIEIFRADPRGSLGPFSTSQIISLAILIAAVYAFVIRSKRK